MISYIIYLTDFKLEKNIFYTNLLQILKNKGSPVAVNTSASATASNSYAENSVSI